MNDGEWWPRRVPPWNIRIRVMDRFVDERVNVGRGDVWVSKHERAGGVVGIGSRDSNPDSWHWSSSGRHRDFERCLVGMGSLLVWDQEDSISAIRQVVSSFGDDVEGFMERRSREVINSDGVVMTSREVFTAGLVKRANSGARLVTVGATGIGAAPVISPSWVDQLKEAVWLRSLPPVCPGVYRGVIFSSSAAAAIAHEMFGHGSEAPPAQGLRVPEWVKCVVGALDGDEWVGVVRDDAGRFVGSRELLVNGRLTGVLGSVDDPCMFRSSFDKSLIRRFRSLQVFPGGADVAPVGSECLFVSDIVAANYNSSKGLVKLRIGAAELGDDRMFGGWIVAPIQDLMDRLLGVGEDRMIARDYCIKMGQRVPVLVDTGSMAFADIEVR